MSIIRRLLKRALLSIPGFFSVCSYLTRQYPRVFMYHRFCVGADNSRTRIDQRTFEWQLSILHSRWKVITFRELLGQYPCIQNQSPYLVVLTIDDGYADFDSIAAPILEKWAMPASLFPVIDFVDGKWLWWDLLRYVLFTAPAQSTSLALRGVNIRVDLRTRKDREDTFNRLHPECGTQDDSTRCVFISEIAKVLGVAVPSSPSMEYAPLTWPQLVRFSRSGHEIGSHTVTHPRLTGIPVAQVRDELRESKKRLENMLGTPVTSLVYPNGMENDVNDDIIQEARESGYEGAALASNTGNLSDAFLISRVVATPDKTDFLWKLCGMETLVHLVRKKLRLSSARAPAKAMA